VGNAKHWISCESQCENIIIQPKMLKHVHSDWHVFGHQFRCYCFFLNLNNEIDSIMRFPLTLTWHILTVLVAETLTYILRWLLTCIHAEAKFHIISHKKLVQTYSSISSWHIFRHLSAPRPTCCRSWLWISGIIHMSETPRACYLTRSGMKHHSTHLQSEEGEGASDTKSRDRHMTSGAGWPFD
jgi:hypothetical protein